ncbi:hypothetical protein CI105_08100 [Candidatus Izimaplasma bacterium ZiA1]|uniref:Rho termination factor N-terminal domain-containing protein n=1 Tax=Candidatus Izimoplasma sp. ZiA1 TaxID=2024899 RepID=UPI000BAA7A62|nr:hypothetical protein CI105_08100 [Candidatus Izimaplasma bacterium ZiA1]
MKKIVFKNMYLNIVLGSLLILLSLLGYFLGWIEDFLPIVIGVLLILLSLKRFLYSFKKITSKNASLILILELLLDFLFAGLMIVYKNNIELYIGLIIYIRGISYLLINYIATRKIRIVQYIFNLGYVTFGAFLMFYPLNSITALVLGVSVLLLLVGAIYLQAGVAEQVKRDKKRDKVNKKIKNSKIVDTAKQDTKIKELEKEVKEVKQENKLVLEETKQLQKDIDKTKLIMKTVETKAIDYKSKTLAELKAIAKERNLVGVSQLNKAQLISKLKE